MLGWGMPRRRMQFGNGDVYHVYNRGVGKGLIFYEKEDYFRLWWTLAYYVVSQSNLRLSFFWDMMKDNKTEAIVEYLEGKERLVKVLALILMPNHFHLMIQQVESGGIVKYMGKVGNSYVRYFNTKYSRRGGLFEGAFSAVQVKTTEQMVHLSRYIHLNNLVAGLVTKKEWFEFPWSSLRVYLGESSVWIDSSLVLEQFDSRREYLEFVEDQADYLRELRKLKRLLFGGGELG